MLLKKGLVTDLARIPHSLDLSSPNMPNTVNAALKPLETLSRIVNQPQTFPNPKNALKPKPVDNANGIIANAEAAVIRAGTGKLKII